MGVAIVPRSAFMEIEHWLVTDVKVRLLEFAATLFVCGAERASHAASELMRILRGSG